MRTMISKKVILDQLESSVANYQQLRAQAQQTKDLERANNMAERIIALMEFQVWVMER